MKSDINQDDALQRHGSSLDTDPNRQLNEKALFILHKGSGVSMYSHYFIPNAIDPQLLAGFVGAMASFLSEFVGFERSQWKTIYGTDTTLIVESGEWAVAVLAVCRETSGLRTQLRIILSEFEATYGALKESFGYDRSILDGFDDFAMRIFSDDRISSTSFIRAIPGWARILADLEGTNGLSEMSQFLSAIEDGKCLARISDAMRRPFRDVKEMAYIASWDGVIHIDHIPSDDDILVPSERSIGVVFSNVDSFEISPMTLEVIGSLDGRCSVYELVGQFNDNLKQRIFAELGRLIRMGYIQGVTPGHQLVIDQERIVNRYLIESRVLVPDSFSVMELLRRKREGLRIHPWLSRIDLKTDGLVQCRIDSTMTQFDFEAMFDALQYLINQVTAEITARVGKTKANAALFRARVTAKQTQSKQIRYLG